MNIKLDTVGHLCPFPLLEGKKAMTKLNKGDSLTIDFDCAQATENLPNWAQEEGYEVTNFEQLGDAAWTITIRK
ncbi:putative redox protein [Haemophilus pittmaniae]|uniref:Putative redox protein n=1 Tax=Haemophilus pittmaniae TaxID=249188 RepID=A0A377IW24_9PAST|nr:sulfurtransferase TusA family protein [Haemophilus pittmaniae]STO92471.1 putative redox protein [Haemophilus pittmaniae]